VIVYIIVKDSSDAYLIFGRKRFLCYAFFKPRFFYKISYRHFMKCFLQIS